MKRARRSILGVGAFLGLLLAAAPVQAAPWWWAQFSLGSSFSGGNSDGIQNLQGRFASSAGINDTVIMASFTWYSVPTSGHMIVGADEDSQLQDFGLVAVSRQAGRVAPVRVLYDTEGSNSQVMLSDISGHPITARGYNDLQFAVVHPKNVYVANRGIMIGSGNFSAAQTHHFGSQPNNYVWLHHSRIPTAVNSFGRYLESITNGVLVRPTRGSWLYHPTGGAGRDTVEIYFSVDDNESITHHTHFNPTWSPAFSAPGYDMEDILSHRSERAVESILYAIDRFTLTLNNGHTSPDGSLIQSINANPRLKAGIADPTDDEPGHFDLLRNNHTARDGNTWPTGSMHHKFMIFDLEIVATGSANHTGAAMRNSGTGSSSNVEDMIVAHDFRMARRFVQHWHYLMNNLPPNTGTGGDNFALFRDNRPGVPTALAVTPTATSFNLTWTAPTVNMARFSRYNVFIAPHAINTNRDIGDGLDDDSDSMIDEDPIGDVDGFASGTTHFTANNDDGDGVSDEDPWLYPEARVRGGGTGVVLTSVNCGSPLLAGTNYWFAVVAVDSMGFESLVDTAGPFQLLTVDTRTIVQLNSHVADSSIPRGADTVVLARLWIRGDTTGTGDTLAHFSVMNLGNADSHDMRVTLWRDNDNDSAWNAGDSLVATLALAGGRWSASGLQTLAASHLGAGAGAGRNFLLLAELFDTAGIGDTIQMRVPALGVDAERWDSGPAVEVVNSGRITIVSANQVTVERRGDAPSAAVARGDTVVAMTLRVGVGIPGDTLTHFAVTNLGSMLNADVAGITLFEDAGADSMLTAADTLIAVLPFASDSTWRNSAISHPFTGNSMNVLVALGVASGATGSRNFQGRIGAHEVRTMNADSGPLAAVTTTTVFTIPSDTAPDTAIVINEIYGTASSPTGQDHDSDGIRLIGDEQYVELHNNSDGFVNIGGWDLGDATPGDATFPAGLIMGPRQFLIMYRNETGLILARWHRYGPDGRVVLESGFFAAGALPSISPTDTVQLRNAADLLIDSFTYSTNPINRSWQRRLDGADTWLLAVPSPGRNLDPDPRFNRPSPNARILLTATPASVVDGDSLTLTLTVVDGDTNTITTFTQTALLSASAGTITPATTGAFAGGVRAESISISGITVSGPVVVTAAFRTTTTGTTTVTVQRRATVTVVVDLEARTDESGCTGLLFNGVDTHSPAAPSDSIGRIVFTGVRPGTYTFAGKQGHHLRRVVTGITVAGADTTVPIGLMRAGDANNENQVNIFDASIVRFFKIFGAGASADIDGNGAVNISDLNWVRTNFGLRGE